MAASADIITDECMCVSSLSDCHPLDHLSVCHIQQRIAVSIIKGVDQMAAAVVTLTACSEVSGNIVLDTCQPQSVMEAWPQNYLTPWDAQSLRSGYSSVTVLQNWLVLADFPRSNQRGNIWAL